MLLICQIYLCSWFFENIIRIFCSISILVTLYCNMVLLKSMIQMHKYFITDTDKEGEEIKSIQSSERAAISTSSMMEETTNENDLQVRFGGFFKSVDHIE